MANSELIDAIVSSGDDDNFNSKGMISCKQSSNTISQAGYSIVEYTDLELSFKCWSSALLELSHKSSFLSPG